MNINWDEALDQIFSRRLVCPRCQEDHERLVVGYSRKPSLTAYAPRHGNCSAGLDCDARKLITLCMGCAEAEHLHGESEGAGGVLASYLFDCRRDLEESLAYLTEYWRDDRELEDTDLDRPFEQVDPDAFAEESSRRRTLEEEYLRYHREFRERKRTIPDPGWRSAYVEDVVELGYETLLGD